MISKKLRIIGLSSLFFIFTVNPVWTQPLEDEYLYGLDLFKTSKYEQASKLFKTVLFDIDSKDLHGDAAFWLSRSYLEMKHYSAAMEIMEEFLLNYTDSSYYLEGQYYKGRLIFLDGEYDKAIHYFSSFITANEKNNPFLANSLFWIGESLYILGRFDEAEEIYRKILDEYSTSIKVEASKYKLSLIEYKYREEELLKLLQWSHEEFLKSSSEYDKKEREFNQALKVYQEKLKELTTTREIYENRALLLSIKEEALKIKEKLIYLSVSEGNNE